MPLYEYECDACGQRFEVIQKFSDAPVEVCAACGRGPVRRLLSSPAIQFKGSGWYITDYAQKGKSESKKGSTDTGEGAAAKTDGSAKTEKPEKSEKSEKKTEPSSTTSTSSSTSKT